MEVIDYNTVKNIIVKFEDGYITNASWGQFCEGNVRNPYDKSIYGIGYLGKGNHKAYINTKKATDQYKTWFSMMNRSYSSKYHEKQPTYKDVTVSEEWHNFQNFAKWYDENFYKTGEDRMCLDKDILIKGNKIYSPSTCLFVPQNINKLFTKRGRERGELPIGVYKRKGKYRADCSDGNGNKINIGEFNNYLEAFEAYKQYKETLIKQIAERYKDEIPEKLYKALITYEVEITD